MVEDVEKIVSRYNRLRSENPLLDERIALERAFYSEDFIEDTTKKVKALRMGENDDNNIYVRLIHISYEKEEFLYSSSAEWLEQHPEIIEEYEEETGIDVNLDDPITEEFEEFVDDWLRFEGYIDRYYFDPKSKMLTVRDGINAVIVNNLGENKTLEEQMAEFQFSVHSNIEPKAIVYFKGRELGRNINDDGFIVEPTKILRVIDTKTGKDIDVETGKVLKKSKGKGWHGEPERHSKARKEGKADLQQYHALVFDFISNLNNTPNFVEDFLTEDVSRKPSVHKKLEKARQAKLERFKRKRVGVSKRTPEAQALKRFHGITPETATQLLPEAIKIGETITPIETPAITQPFQIPTIETISGLTDRQMTPVASSFVKGVGAYKGHLLIEYHHDPNIWGYPVGGEQAGNFFNEIMMSGSKGGWVWDKLLGKPSIYGMEKGKFFAYQDPNSNEMKYYTTPGAQFVHLEGRPAKFTYNPVGYAEGGKGAYEQQAKVWKEYKEKIVEPPKSREPAEAELIKQQQEKEAQLMEELRVLFKQQGLDFIDDMDEEVLRERLNKAEKYMVGMNDMERETYLRSLFMDNFSIGKFDFKLVEDFKLNINPAEARLLLSLMEDVDRDDPMFNTILRSIATKIENVSIGKFGEVEESAMFERERREPNLVKAINQITDILIELGYEEDNDWQLSIIENFEEINDWEGLLDHFIDTVGDIAYDKDDEWIEKLVDDSDKIFEGLTKPKEALNFIEKTIGSLHKESEEWYSGIKENFEDIRGNLKKGKGWWGDPEGHSRAAKLGKKVDLIEDIKEEDKESIERIIKRLERNLKKQRSLYARKNREALKRLIEKFKKKLEGLKKNQEIDQGRGWHGEPERHSQAAKKGKKIDFTYLTKLSEDLYVDGHAHIIYPLKDLTDNQIKSVFNANKELRKAGILFDTGYNVDTDEREWQMDWSLKGAHVKVETLEDYKKWKKGKKDLTEDIEVGRWITIKGNHVFIPTKPLIKEMEGGNLTHKHDFIDFSTFETDFTEDYTHMYGPISHGRKGGHFDYRDPNDPKKIIRLYKDYDSLKEATKVDYFPIIGTQGKGAHRANVIGFSYGFEPKDETEQIFAHSILFNDLVDISDIPIEAKRQVSIGFNDEIIDDIQYVKSIDHLAMSLDNKEIGRCEMGGKSCFMEVKTDMGECPYGIQPVLSGLRQVITITNRGELKN